MAVGKLPFPGASFGQMLASGSQPAVPAPSRARAGVPASLDALVAKLLQKDPAKRPQSAANVARELSGIADRLAAPPSRVRSLLRPVFAVPAAVLLLALVLLSFLFWKPGWRATPNHITDPQRLSVVSFVRSALLGFDTIARATYSQDVLRLGGILLQSLSKPRDVGVYDADANRCVSPD